MNETTKHDRAMAHEREDRTDSTESAPYRRLLSLFRADSGQGLVEFALALPIMLVILLGMVEFASAYDRVHGLAGLSREGANIASRGAGLSEVMNVVMRDGHSLEVDQYGGAVVSRIVVRQGKPVVEAQLASDGYETSSRLTEDDLAARWIASAGLAEGSTHYTVELFLAYQPVTPLPTMFGVAPSMLYERALF